MTHSSWFRVPGFQDSFHRELCDWYWCTDGLRRRECTVLLSSIDGGRPSWVFTVPFFDHVIVCIYGWRWRHVLMNAEGQNSDSLIYHPYSWLWNYLFDDPQQEWGSSRRLLAFRCSIAPTWFYSKQVSDSRANIMCRERCRVCLCSATQSQPHEMTGRWFRGSLADRMNGYPEYTKHTHEQIKEAVRVQRFDMCTLFATARVVENGSGWCSRSICTQLYAGCAVARAVEGNLSDNPSWYSAYPTNSQVEGRNESSAVDDCLLFISHQRVWLK